MVTEKELKAAAERLPVTVYRDTLYENRKRLMDFVASLVVGEWYKVKVNINNKGDDRGASRKVQEMELMAKYRTHALFRHFGKMGNELRECIRYPELINSMVHEWEEEE